MTKRFIHLLISFSLLAVLLSTASPAQAQFIFPPFPFYKQFPANGQANVLNSDSLSWSPSPFADAYYLCVQTTLTYDCNNWMFLGDTTSYPMSSLDKGVTYYWMVVAVNNYGTEYSDNGTWYSFTTMPMPGAFNKTTPTNGAADQNLSLTLGWAPATTTDTYLICVDTVDDNTCNASWTNVGNVTSTTKSGLASGLTYYWQVRAYNDNGSTYANGGTWWHFSTYNLPAAFNKTYPSNGAAKVPITPTLTWSTSSYATEYRWCVDTTSDNLCDTAWTTTTNTQANVTGLLPNTVYYWQVRALNSRGSVYADGNAWFTFRTLPEPGDFTKTAPADASTDVLTRTLFTWKTSVDASTYRICVDTDNDGLCSTSWKTTSQESIIYSGLQPSTIYYWQVQATNTSGMTEADDGAWWSFTTVPAPAVFAKLDPPDGAINQLLVATLTWDVSADFTSYKYCVDTSNNDDCNSTWNDVASETTALVLGLAPDRSYYWQVKAVNPFGETEANGGEWWHFSTYHLPAAFSKVAPVNGMPGVPTNPVLSWNSSSFADSYEYCFDTSNNGICNNSWVPTALLTAQPTGLVPGSTYYWQVRAVNAFTDTQANGGVWWSFTILPAPGTFNKLTPANGTGGLTANPSLTWSSSTSALHYEYCVDNVDGSTCDLEWIATTSQSIALTNLTPGATYYWQVRAVNASGETEANGGTWFSFTPLALPGSFSKTNPANAAFNQPISALGLAWQSASDATNYRYCYDTTNNNACSGNWITTSATTAVLNGLSPSTTYYWQVEAVNLNGSSAANGGTWYSFSTLPLPGSFSKTNPSNGLTNLIPTSINLTWEASANTNTYLVCYDQVNNGICDGSWTATVTNSLSLSNLLSFATYFWQVRAVNTNGETTANSGTWWNFATTLGAVVPTSPVGVSAPPTPTFIWPRVNGATWYFFQINNAAGNVFSQWYDAPTYCTSTTCTIIPAVVLPPGGYRWTVMSWGNGLTGPWSSEAVFTVLTVPAKTVLVSPSTNTSAIQPVFTWMIPSGAPTNYEIWIDKVTDRFTMVYDQWLPSGSAGCGFSTCATTISVSLAVGDYKWWVRAKNGSGNGPWSDPMSFKVVPVPPAAPVLISPISDATASTVPVFTFSHVVSATWYLLEVHQSSPAGPVVIRQWYPEATPPVGTYFTAASPINLLPDIYSWRVFSWNAGGTGPASAWASFGAVAPPGQPTLRRPSGEVNTLQPTFEWDKVGGAVDYLLWINNSGGVIYNQWLPSTIAGCGVATCSITSPLTLSAGDHAFWVQARNSAGVGPWSTSMKFKAYPPPPAAVTSLTHPVSGEQVIPRPTFSWPAAARATWYQVEIRQGSAIGTISHKAWYTAAALGCSPTCQLTLTTSLSSGTYYWNVQTWNTGGYSDWMPSYAMFVVPVPPGTPVLIEPKPVLTVVVPYPSYYWNAVSGAYDYWVYVADPAGTVLINSYITAPNANCGSGAGVCSFQPMAAHTSNGTYTWWVKARYKLLMDQFMEGAWSLPLKFNVYLPAPGMVELRSVGTSVNQPDPHFPTFTWSDTPNATYYTLEVLNGPTVVWSKRQTDLQACGTTMPHGTATNCIATSTVNIPAGPYTWWVLSENQTYALWTVPQGTFTVAP